VPIEVHPSGCITVTGAAAIDFYRTMVLKSALGLELKGIRAIRGKSAYAITKREFGFKGNKQRVYDQLCALIETMKANAAHGGTEQ